jgi:hypothetical protein
MGDVIEERDLALAKEHPRGTERRTLLPYRDALQSPDAYARLPQRDRDVIVRWAEIRRLVRERGVDSDPRNLADPLIPADDLRHLVVEGERIAARAPLKVEDAGRSLLELVAGIRTGAKTGT